MSELKSRETPAERLKRRSGAILYNLSLRRATKRREVSFAISEISHRDILRQNSENRYGQI